jgi:hypothetical protein
MALVKKARGEKSGEKEAWKEAIALYEAAGVRAGIKRPQSGSLYARLIPAAFEETYPLAAPHASE